MNPQRYARICEMLAGRQPDLTVCLEHVHKHHNVSAIIRTADAVGIHQIYAIWPTTKMNIQLASAAGSNSWVQVKTYLYISDVIRDLRLQGMQILATHLSDKSVDFRTIDYTRPTCILMGHEKNGIVKETLALADQEIIIPMSGMVQSLNVSVASALILYEAQRQRQNADMYQRAHSILAQNEQQRLLFEGGYPILAQVAKRKGLSRPQINEQGKLIADKKWWSAMQATESLK